MPDDEAQEHTPPAWRNRVWWFDTESNEWLELGPGLATLIETIPDSAGAFGGTFVCGPTFDQAEQVWPPVTPARSTSQTVWQRIKAFFRRD